MGQEGGAISIKASSQNIVILKSTFQGNTNVMVYLRSGGAIHLQLTGEPNFTALCNQKVSPIGTEQVISIIDCSFKLNQGSFGGGAISAVKGVLIISNSYFSNNVAPLGGAVELRSSFAFFRMNNFIGNKATAFRGCVHLGR